MKQEVDVVVYYTKHGCMVPQTIIWDQEHVYEIDEIKKMERTGIWSDGRESFTYLCSIRGQDAHLYFGPDRWYVYLPDQ